MMRSRVGLGMCLADGASFRTAETVPADRPTCAATDFRVTVFPFDSVVFLSLLIASAVQQINVLATPLVSVRFRASHYIQGEGKDGILRDKGMVRVWARRSDHR